MTVTYSGNPGSTPGDTIRFLLSDTVVSDALLTDEEIAWVLSTVGGTDVYGAAAICARQIGAKFTRRADSETNGDISVTWVNAAKRWFELADQLNRNAGDQLGIVATFHADDGNAGSGPQFWIGQFDSGRSIAWGYTRPGNPYSGPPLPTTYP